MSRCSHQPGWYALSVLFGSPTTSLTFHHRRSGRGHQSLERRRDHRAGRDHDVVAAFPQWDLAQRLTQSALGPVPPDRIADRPAGDECDP